MSIRCYFVSRKKDSGLAAAPSGGTPEADERDEKGFAAHDDADYHELYGGAEYYKRQQLTDTEKEAMDFYSDPEPESALEAPSADGLHSPSQDLNWALANGIPLSAKQQAMYDRLMGAMHNTGYNILLNRYDHAPFVNDILRSIGVRRDATTMSVDELRDALVGVKYAENRFVSGSANNFKNALGDGSKWNKAVFTERYVKITYKVDANVQSVMPGNYSKKDPRSGLTNRLHEQILAPSRAGHPNYEIEDVKLSGAKAHPKGSRIGEGMYLNQIEIVVRVRKQ